MTTLTINLDTATEADALYAIDKLSRLLSDPDPITAALAAVAYDIADTMEPGASWARTFALADELYPQTEGIWTPLDSQHLAAKRDEHLRRFGMLSERIAA